MDFQEEKYAKGATGYGQRIRNTFPFYETIHPTMNAMLRGLVRSDGQLLIVVEAGRMELELASFDLPLAIDNARTFVRERAVKHAHHARRCR